VVTPGHLVLDQVLKIAWCKAATWTGLNQGMKLAEVIDSVEAQGFGERRRSISALSILSSAHSVIAL